MVSIPISADVSGLQQAFDRLNEALNRAGQSAKALSQVDLSHPELRDFAADLSQINDRFDRLTTQGRGEAAAAARQFRQSGNLFGQGGLLTGGVSNIYPNQTTAARVQAQLQGYLLNGTSFSPQQQQQQLQLQQGGAAGGGSMFSGVAGLAGGAASSMLGMLGIGSLAVMAKTAFELAQKQGVAVDTFMRRINDSGADFDHFRGALSEATRGLGLTSTAFVAAAQTYQRLSGESGDVTGNTRFAIGAARAFGTEEGTFAAGMGRAQFGGIDGKQFALLVGEAVVRGGQTGQTEQVMGALERGLESLNRNLVSGGAISGGFGQFASLYTTLNQQAVASGAPGLRGAGALNALETINQSVMSGGNAGMAGQLLTMSAFNRQGIHDPYRIGGTIEGGMFARIGEGGKSGPTVLQTEMEEINRRYGANATGEGQYLYRNVIERMLGLRQPVTQALQAMPEIGPQLTGLYRGGSSSLMNALGHAGVTDLNAINPTSLQDLIHIGLGSSDELGKYRERALARDDLTDAQKAQISGAKPDDLRDALLKVYAQAGQEKDDATKLRESMARLQEGFITVGGKMIDALMTLEEDINALNSWMQGVGKKIGDALGLTGVGDSAQEGAKEFGGFYSDMQANGFGAAIRRYMHLGEGGGVPGPQSVSTAEQKATASLIVGTMAPLLGEHGAFGLAGEAMLESGMNPRARNPTTGAYGLFQYMPGASRTKLLEDYLEGKPLYSWTKEDQIRAKAYDLTLGSEHKVGNRLRAAQTDEEAGAIAVNEDARAYNPWDSRYAMYAKAAGQTAKNIRNQLTPGMFPLPPEPPAGGAGGGQSILRIDPLTVNHQVNGIDIWQQALPTSVTSAQPNNPAKPLFTPSNTGSAPPAPAPPMPKPPVPPAAFPAYNPFPMVQ